MRILHIDSSITGDASISRQLTTQIVETLREAEPVTDVVRRDLHAEPLPHLDGQVLAALASGASGDVAAHDAAALDEFLAADVVVIGAPMYNFSVASQLKAWIDRIVVAGRTFRYTEQGPEGLAGGKRVIIASSRGGFYASGTGQAAMDFQESYLSAVFGFIGVEQVEFIRAEGIATGADVREAALIGALQSITALADQTDSAAAA